MRNWVPSSTVITWLRGYIWPHVSLSVTVDIVFSPENCEVDLILSCSYLCTNITMSHEKLIHTFLLTLSHCDMF
jgi:hypothetical protein